MADMDGHVPQKDRTAVMDTWNFHMVMLLEYYRTTTEWDTPKAACGSVEFINIPIDRDPYQRRVEGRYVV
jgi:hypothetical protein